MKEEGIRPLHLVHENQRLLAEDIAELMLHKNEFVNVSCPSCESPKFVQRFEKQEFTYVECLDCKTYYINPRPTFKLLENFYINSKCLKHWKNIFSETEEYRKNQIFVPRVERVIDLCKKHNSPVTILLDVGAGYGTFCEEIGKKNFFNKIIAVEPSHELAVSCRTKELDVIEKPIESIGIHDVSVITCFELIEHLFNPKDFVISCYTALSKGGMLILTTPNVKGFDIITLEKLSGQIQGPNHLNYFHPKSLSDLLEKCGFEVIEILTPGKLDVELVRNKILSGEFDVSHQKFLEQILIEKWSTLGNAFQNFLVEHKLSSHMWIVAKKK